MALDPSEVAEPRHVRGSVRPINSEVVRPLQPSVARPLSSRTTRAFKRTVDLVTCSLALVALLPMFAIIAAAIKLDSRGPIFYRQVRIGFRGKPFVIWKFRTMRPDADRIAPNVSPTSDPRVTTVGRFLRASYLDELPQLLNVITGRMSVVGPRPETPEFVALYSAEERRVFEVRPGLLGPSTLASTDESALLETADDPFSYYVDVLMHERVRQDLAYLDEMSFVTDMRLLLRQVYTILIGRG